MTNELSKNLVKAPEPKEATSKSASGKLNVLRFMMLGLFLNILTFLLLFSMLYHHHPAPVYQWALLAAGFAGAMFCWAWGFSCRQQELDLKDQHRLAMADLNVETASTAKNEFLANISHELRTPLNSIIVLSQIMAEDRKEELSEKHKKYSRTVLTSARGLLRLIGEILDLTKAEAGKIEFIQERVDLHRVRNEITELFCELAKEGNVDFSVKVDMVVADIQMDGFRLNQVLKNLLSNAIKFTPNGSVSCRFFDPSEEQVRDMGLTEAPIDYFAFEVHDSGRGIAQNQLLAIFEPFLQGDGSTSRSYGGTGLGLSISKRLCVLMGGDIKVSSEEGQGSTFAVCLPRISDMGAEQ